jgi:hypothetical protein
LKNFFSLYLVCSHYKSDTAIFDNLQDFEQQLVRNPGKCP